MLPENIILKSSSEPRGFCTGVDSALHNRAKYKMGDATSIKYLPNSKVNCVTDLYSVG